MIAIDLSRLLLWPQAASYHFGHQTNAVVEIARTVSFSQLELSAQLVIPISFKAIAFEEKRKVLCTPTPLL